MLSPDFINTPIAHRGLHNSAESVIENSQSAFAEAINSGFGIECDIQLTKDNDWIVFHDYELDRLTGNIGSVSAHSLAEMEALFLKGSQDHPLSLAKLFGQVRDQVPLIIEVKDPTELFEPLEEAPLRNLVKALNLYQGRLAIMSFNPILMGQLRVAMPDASLGLVTDNFDLPDWSKVPEATRNEARKLKTDSMDFISHNREYLNMVKDLKLPKLCWTVRTVTQEQEARRIADNITFEHYLPQET